MTKQTENVTRTQNHVPIKHRKSKNTRNPRVDPLPTTAQKNPNGRIVVERSHTLNMREGQTSEVLQEGRIGAESRVFGDLLFNSAIIV